MIILPEVLDVSRTNMIFPERCFGNRKDHAFRLRMSIIKFLTRHSRAGGTLKGFATHLLNGLLRESIS
jgi:hypothetical protein